MSAEFSGGYGSIRGQSGDNQDDRGSSGAYQSEDYVIFQSLSDTISSNILQIKSNVQALERICKQLGNQLKEISYDKLHRIQQSTNKLANDTTVCLKRMINLQGGSISERSSTTPVVENQNSMEGEDMDVDSNNNHDQTTFPPATDGFTFNTPTAGNTSLFSAGTSAAPGGTPGGFNFTPSSGPAPTFQFGTNKGTPSGGFNGAAPAGSSPFIFGGASAPAGGTSSPSAPTAPFNFGGSSVGSKREMNVVVPTNDQPNMFNIGAGQSRPDRVYRKAVRRNKR